MHLTPAQNFHHSNQPSQGGTPYLGHTSRTLFSYGDSSSRSGTAEPQGGTPHDSFQPLYPAHGNNHQMMAQMNFRQSTLLQTDHGHDNGSNLHATVARLIAENQRLSNITDQLFASNKTLTEQLSITQDIVGSLKNDFLQFSDKFGSKASKKTAAKNTSNEHLKLKVCNLPSFTDRIEA